MLALIGDSGDAVTRADGVSIMGVLGPPLNRELQLDEVIEELDEAPLDSLSPVFQDLKLGFEELRKDMKTMRGVEIRANRLLSAAGEPPLAMLTKRVTMDRSQIPPIRRPRTEAEVEAESEQMWERLDELKDRKPELYNAIHDLMIEILSSREASSEGQGAGQSAS